MEPANGSGEGLPTLSDRLTVRGERYSEQTSNVNGYRRLERSSGSFRRSVRLPQGVDASAIEANFDRGVLEISVPKPQAAQPQRVEITVGTPAEAPTAS